ncbi:MAG: hypothetical protein ABDH49_06755 [Candidatus Hydrothermales bacterium]
MKCPVCKIELTKKKFKNLNGNYKRVYQCFQCGGLLFENLLGLETDKEDCENLEEVYRPLLNATFPIQLRRIYKCPRCNKRFSKYLNSKYRDLFILLCKNCNTMFFNRGKFYKPISKNERRAKLKDKDFSKDLIKKISERGGANSLSVAMEVLISNNNKTKNKEELYDLFLNDFFLL